MMKLRRTPYTLVLMSMAAGLCFSGGNTYAQTPDDEIIIEEMEMFDDQPPGTDVPGNDVIEAVEPEITPPPQSNLEEPQNETFFDPEALANQNQNTPTQNNSEDENLFFDAESLVPQGEISSKGAPQRVNPRLQPGSRFVIVKKDHAGSSRQANLVSAERAMRLGRIESALDIYNTIYAKNKKDPNALMGRAVAYHRLGQDEFAIQAYEELLDVKPGNVAARVNMLGIIGQRYPAVALRQLMDLYKDNPNNVGIAAQIAVVQSKLGNQREAIRFLGIAASMEPQNATHVFNMAVIADRAGSRTDAIKFYEQALETDTLYGKGASIPRETIFERLAELR